MTSSGVDLSRGGSSSRAAPLAIEGVGDVDTEAYPVATSAKDASGVPLSVRCTTDMATCTNDGSGRAASAHDIEDTTGHAVPATGTPDARPFVCSPVDTAIGWASSVDATADPAPLPLTYGATSADFWCVCRRARLFFRASLRRVPYPPTLRKTR